MYVCVRVCMLWCPRSPDIGGALKRALLLFFVSVCLASDSGRLGICRRCFVGWLIEARSVVCEGWKGTRL